MSLVAHACPPMPFPEGAGRSVGPDRERQVLDLFRHIAAFRVNYDAELLERAEAYAARLVGPAQSDDLMAAAIRIDNEMRCQTTLDYAPLPVGSSEKHEYEEAFLGLVQAVCNDSERVALGLALRLGVTETRALFADARALAATLGWPSPRRVQRDAPARTVRQPWHSSRSAYGRA